MATIPEPYRIADATLKSLNRKAARRLDQLKRRLVQLKFDDLNVFDEVKTFYAEMDQDCMDAFRKLYEERYRELWGWMGKKPPDEDELDELMDIRMSDLLFWPNKLTHYAWDTETARKRDRAIEAIQASPTSLQKQLELDKAVRYFSQQTAFYIDIVSQDAEQEAYRQAGVKKVRWMIYGDDRVCDTCDDLNGTVWDIDKVPTRPHPRCRCYLVPVSSLS